MKITNYFFTDYFFTFFVKALFVLMLLFSVNAIGQTDITFNWDYQVNCSNWAEDPKRGLSLEEIDNAPCIQVCEQTQVSYFLENVPNGSTVTWSLQGGGVIISQSTINNINTCIVNWNDSTGGNLSFLITNGNTSVTKTICIETVTKPNANFKMAGGLYGDPHEICRNQTLNFINLSHDNNGSPLTNYTWAILNHNNGSITYYNTFEPSHVFTEDALYTITLTVFNSCWCSDSYEEEILVKSKGFDIYCPNVICENQTEVYSLPFDGMDLCQNSFNWSVIGSNTTVEAGGNIEILWDNVDSSGFGYVTFDPSNCDVECHIPSTIRIPVLLQNGTIFGNTEICLGKQEIFSLPQWPTTDFQWEIVGDPNNSTGQLIFTDQRNEIVVQPNGTSNTIVLRCIYNNTLLNCGGVAEITINVKPEVEIQGSEHLCQNSTGVFTNSQNSSGTWQILNAAGNQIYTTTSNTLSYTFNTVGNFLIKFKHPNYCESHFWTTVITKPSPPVILGTELEYCPNVSYPFEISNPNANYTYEWAVSSGGVFNGGNTGTQIAITFSSGTNPVVSARAISNHPAICHSNYTNFPINLKQIQAAINGDVTVCSSSIADYTLNIPNSTSLFTNYDEIIWTVSNPTLGSVAAGQNTSEVTINWNNSSNPEIVDLIANVYYCNEVVAIKLPITLQLTTEIQLSVSDAVVCNNENVTFTISPVGAGSPMPTNFEVEWNINGTTFTNQSLSHTTSFANVGLADVTRTVSAKVINLDCNTTSNTATTTITVNPGPEGSISLSSNNGNMFCNANEINVSFTVAMPPNCTVKWFKVNTPQNTIVAGNIPTLTVVGANPGFGVYYALITNPITGCTTRTNSLNIIQKCLDILPCTLSPNPVVQNLATNNCGTLLLDKYFSSPPIDWWWDILGPESHTNYTGSTIALPAGLYKMILNAKYNCLEGYTTNIVEVKDVLVPYVPNFNYMVTCSNNNSFTINFFDTTSYYAPVANTQAVFAYKPLGGSFTTLTGTTITLPQGVYDFKITVNGSYNGSTQPPCEKTEANITLFGISNFNIATSPALNEIACHNKAVEFSLNPQPLGLSLLWDFDDDGATNSMAEPSRVFNTSGLHNVTVTITNNLGCERDYTVPVVIPSPCFNGDLTTNPSPATACIGAGVTLMYVPSATDSCTVQEYQWMKGNTLVGTTISPAFVVQQSGLYWIKVVSTANCSYATNRVNVQVVPLPTANINGSTTFCENETAHFTLNTNATDVQWVLNGAGLPAYANQTEIELAGLAIGNYQLQATVQQSGCANTTTHNFEVVAQPQVTIDYKILSCNPYAVSLSVSGVPAQYQVNWSNGMNGSSIVVNFGGVYQAVVSNGTCSVAINITVPKNPESFLWIFPEGCYDNCKIEDKNNMLIGPLGQFDSWSWNHNGNPDSSGSGTVTPYFVTQDGTYNLVLSNGVCTEESKPLHFSTLNCEHCQFEMNTNIQVEKANLPYCAYVFTLTIYSPYLYPIQATLSDYYGNSIIQPAGITIQPGSNTFNFTVIPIHPFTGGATLWELSGTFTDLDTGETVNCTRTFEVFIPECFGEGFSTIYQDKKASTTPKTAVKVALYPNPATDRVTVDYENIANGSTLYLYDQMGRLMQQTVLENEKGTTQISLQSMLPGLYIAVVKHKDVFVAQYKLIKE